MKRIQLNLPIRTVLLYIVFGSLWILLSDDILFLFTSESAKIHLYQTIKGWFFIIASSALLYVLLTRELGARRQAEHEVKVSEERLSDIVESAMDGIISIDTDHRIVLVNSAAEQMFGYPQGQLTGKPIDILIPETFREMHHRHVVSFGESGKIRPSRESLSLIYGLHADGTEFPIEASISQTQRSEQKIFTIILRDVSEQKKIEKELKETRELFQAIFDLSPLATTLSRVADRLIIDVNAATEALLGYTRDELVGKPSTDFDYWVNPEARQRGYEILLERGKLRNYEFTYRTRLGKIGQAVLFIEVFEQYGEKYFLSHFVDITERKQAEEELQRSEEKYRTLVETAEDVILLTDVNGKHLYRNSAYYTSLGFDVNEDVDLDGYSRVHPDDIQQMEQITENLIAHGSAVHEYRVRHKDGHWVIRQAKIATLYDSSHAPEAFLSIIRDVTERRRIEEQLAYQARLLEEVSDAIISCDMTSNITSWNSAAEQIYGWTAEEVLGKPLNHFLQTSYENGNSEAIVLQQFLAQGVWKGEVAQRRKDGGWITILASVSLIRDQEGQPLGMVAINRDITTRKLAEKELRALNDQLEQRVAERTEELHRTNLELERANHAKDEFLANMSHELRTPLNSILGLSETLLEQRRGPLTEKQMDAIQWISNSGTHLLNLINDILDVAKVESGKLQLHPVVISIQDVCESSMNFVRQAAAQKSIALEFRNDAGVQTLNADAQRLKQILVNLLSNAVKFTPERGLVCLAVTIDREQELVEFIVSDTGIGISSSDLSKLFTPFTQVDSSLSRQYAGTGLGLVLVYKYTEMHGGSVYVESEVGQGSRFTIKLPIGLDGVDSREESDKERVTSKEAQQKNEGNNLEVANDAKSVLLVEDNETNIFMIYEYLEDRGYQVAVAHNGLEAIEKVATVDPHIILMDIQMPVMDGLEAISRLRKNSRFTSTPIIALTALAMPGDRERCLAAGVNEYLSKPVRLKVLLNTIETLLKIPGKP